MHNSFLGETLGFNPSRLKPQIVAIDPQQSWLSSMRGTAGVHISTTIVLTISIAKPFTIEATINLRRSEDAKLGVKDLLWQIYIAYSNVKRVVGVRDLPNDRSMRQYLP